MIDAAIGPDNDSRGKRERRPCMQHEPMDRLDFGDHLRKWRRVRRLSQLGLAEMAGVSARHVSFLETGRSLPSREMVLKLAQALGVPFRERNPMLASAGFAAMYRTRDWDDPDLRLLMQSVRTVLAAHMPHPALALDRLYNVVATNAAAAMLLRALLPHDESATINVIRATLHPEGLAPLIVNFTDWREDVLTRLARQVQLTGDAALAELYREVSTYPMPCGTPAPERMRQGMRPDVILTLELRVEQQILRFITALTVFGSPHDILLQEIAIETFLAADEATARFLRGVASSTGDGSLG